VELTGIPGAPPDLGVAIDGCPFAARCSEAKDVCHDMAPSLYRVGAVEARCLQYSPDEANAWRTPAKEAL
ncbi:MAG TPA: hypothetical protein VH442_03730, partial [Micromonosporaceae bacterium]